MVYVWCVSAQPASLRSRLDYGRSCHGRWKPTSDSWLATSIYLCSRFWVNLKNVEICENQGGTLGKFSDFVLGPEQIFQGSPLGFHKFQLSSNAVKTRYRGKSRSLITNLESVFTSHGRIFRNSTGCITAQVAQWHATNIQQRCPNLLRNA